jgi:hypothetical protein
MNVWHKDKLDVEDAEEYVCDRDIHSADGNGYDEFECNWLAEDISRHYYNHYDGYELADSWQGKGIDLALFDDNKKYIGTFNTTLDFDPTFHSCKVK